MRILECCEYDRRQSPYSYELGGILKKIFKTEQAPDSCAQPTEAGVPAAVARGDETTVSASWQNFSKRDPRLKKNFYRPLLPRATETNNINPA
jgi:hypothetical protein